MSDRNRTPINGNKTTNLTLLRLNLEPLVDNLHNCIKGKWGDSDSYCESLVERIEELKEIPWENPPQFDALIAEVEILKERMGSIDDDDDEDDSETAQKLVEMAKRMLAANPNDEEAKNTLKEYDKGVKVITTWEDAEVDLFVFLTATLERLCVTTLT